MARPILVANWKNYPESLSAANSIALGLSKKRVLYKKLSIFIAPPLPYFESVSKRIKSFAGLASQDIFFEGDGTHTGFITPDILKNFSVKLSIIGHSERRALGETDELVSEKVKVALRAGIQPLVCIGEKVHDPDGEHFQFIRDQIRQSLSSIKKREEAKKIIIAYEPIWAIGAKAKGAISPTDLTQMVIFIRKVLTEMFNRDTALSIAILYGGSVDPSSAVSLFTGTGIRGFLVGRASLDHKSFAAIAESLI